MSQDDTSQSQFITEAGRSAGRPSLSFYFCRGWRFSVLSLRRAERVAWWGRPCLAPKSSGFDLQDRREGKQRGRGEEGGEKGGKWRKGGRRDGGVEKKEGKEKKLKTPVRGGWTIQTPIQQ